MGKWRRIAQLLELLVGVNEDGHGVGLDFPCRFAMMFPTHKKTETRR